MNALYDPATRQFIAYGLMLLTVISVAAIVGWNRHHSGGQVEARRRQRASQRERSTLAPHDAAEQPAALDN
jgi:hypothetical protein